MVRIVLHPGDNPAMYHRLFRSDPETFKPKPNPELVDSWGVRPDDEWFEEMGMQTYMHQMTTQFLYGSLSKTDLKHPEEQFVEVLAKRKEAAVAAALPAVSPLFQQDLIIDIEVQRVTPRVWRHFKVSGGMTLAVLQDKVISPVMGWVRHYHAYCFHDGKDGAVFGPINSTAIDMMHAKRHLVLMMDDTKYRLAQLLNKPGDKATYTYDLGDNWYHTLTLVEVLPPEQSDGTCKVLDGAMACPPEDSNGFEGMGNRNYQKYLKEWAAAKGSKQKALVRGAQKASNTGPSWQPDKFSVAECNKALAAALRSKASTAGGEKEFVFPLQPGGENMFDGPRPSRGQDLRSIARPNGCFERDTISTRRDPRNLAVCAECGSPNDLKYCSGCRQVRFCGPACHKKAWKAWHKAECQEYQQKHKKGAASSSSSAT